MSFTAENRQDPISSVRTAWQHCKEAFLASSPDAAWQACKNMVQAMPMWLLVLSVVAVTALVLNPFPLRTLLGGAAFLLVAYFTVRQAVRDEHRRLNRVEKE